MTRANCCSCGDPDSCQRLQCRCANCNCFLCGSGERPSRTTSLPHRYFTNSPNTGRAMDALTNYSTHNRVIADISPSLVAYGRPSSMRSSVTRDGYRSFTENAMSQNPFFPAFINQFSSMNLVAVNEMPELLPRLSGIQLLSINETPSNVFLWRRRSIPNSRNFSASDASSVPRITRQFNSSSVTREIAPPPIQRHLHSTRYMTFRIYLNADRLTIREIPGGLANLTTLIRRAVLLGIRSRSRVSSNDQSQQQLVIQSAVDSTVDNSGNSSEERDAAED